MFKWGTDGLASNTLPEQSVTVLCIKLELQLCDLYSAYESDKDGFIKDKPSLEGFLFFPYSGFSWTTLYINVSVRKAHQIWSIVFIQ